MNFVDTNYFLRFLLSDVDKQHQEAKELFQKASSGKVKLFTSLIVFFELYWVLSSFYKKDKENIVNVLNRVMAMSFIEVQNRDLLEESLDIFSRENIELEDAFNIAFAEYTGAEEFKTFDRRLNKVWQNYETKETKSRGQS